jgi:hypothetical protein
LHPGQPSLLISILHVLAVGVPSFIVETGETPHTMSRFFRRKEKKDDLASAAANSDIQPAPADRPVTQDAVLSEKEQGLQEDAEDGAPGDDLAQVKTTATEDIVYPSGLKLGFLLASIFVSMFLVSLDRLIISTAIPQITDDFHSVTDIGWYGSAYLLSNAAFQLMYGKLYTFFSIKIVFITAIVLFEVGSAVCGAAPNSVAFIVGRAIAGLGSAGIMSGAIVILIYSVPLHRRPLYQGLFGAIFGISSVVGPLLGGAFTSKVTWRWCFYINLPFGGVAIALLFFLLNIPEREETKKSLGSKLAQLDAIGTTVFLPGVVCLLLALQWGGSKYPVGSVLLSSPLKCYMLTVTTVARRPHHRPPGASRRPAHHLRSRTDLQARHGHRAPSHLQAAQHHRRLVGHALHRLADDDLRLLPAHLVPGHQGR